MLTRFTSSLGLWVLSAGVLFAAIPQFKTQEIETGLGVGYAVRLIDMNGDGKLDVCVVDTTRVVWYENPTWKRHAIIQDQTKKDNVCFAEYDLDGDGQVEFALGADWRPFDTKTGGTIQWLKRDKTQPDRWDVIPIGEAPTVHRMQWADLDRTGKKQLIVVPLMGKDTTPPKYAEVPTPILSYRVPANPLHDRWPVTVLNADLHVCHNFAVTDLDRDGHPDLIVASFEGVSCLCRDTAGKWTRTHIGIGYQTESPNRGASEIKHGKLSGGRDFIATIEPWHGNQVVVYTPPADAQNPTDAVTKMWTRHVLDEDLKWGHAVWCAKLDESDNEQLIIGVRDNKSAEHRCGLRIYEPQDSNPTQWTKHIIDPGGVAIEDLAAGDLDGDGRIDIVAVGRATKNVRIYWNQGGTAK